jgi:hypothetical protein
MSEKGKKRSKPYSDFERSLLLELIDERKGILENKKHDSIVSRKKELAWDSISNKYNSEPLGGRVARPRTLQGHVRDEMATSQAEPQDPSR